MAGDRETVRGAAHRTVALALQAAGLGALWLVFSGKFDALHLGFGLFSVGLVLLLTHRLTTRRRVEGAGSVTVRPLELVLYLGWLAKEIVVANLDIARLVVIPSLPIDPVLVRFTTSLPNTVARVALGNSITLTPGTLTLEITGREVLVHAISAQGATGPAIDAMERRLARVFGASVPPAPLEMIVSRALAPGDDGPAA